MALATRTRTKKIAPSSFHGLGSRLVTIEALSSLLMLSSARADCNVNFLYPTSGLTFNFLDTVNVSYTSTFTDPSLLCFCGSSMSKRIDKAPSFDGVQPFQLDFTSQSSCWFELRDSSATCENASPHFNLLSVQRAQGGGGATLGLLSTTTPSSSLATAVAATQTPSIPGAGDTRPGDLSPGARAGLGVAIAAASIMAVSIASCFYFRRRRRSRKDALGGHLGDENRDGRSGQRRKESLQRSRSSAGSGRSEQRLTVQPVFDGFPGSTGYDDVPSMGSSTHLHSPTWPHSPTLSATGGFSLTERDELSAARMNSPAVVTAVTSYGPNRVTPSLTPRPSQRLDESSRAGSSHSYDDDFIPAAALQSLYTPKKPAIKPIVVSYGPNKVTPTPVVKSTTVPPDNSVLNRVPDFPAQVYAAPERPHTSWEEHDRQPAPWGGQEAQFNSWDGQDEQLGPFAPLPPYASSADFYAMEKGAIRKMAEPTAQAELPPTKDGYYHFGDIQNEHELPGAAPHRAAQLPYLPYRNMSEGRARELDEQKFLLDDVEIKKMKMKQKQKAETHAAGYELTDMSRASSSTSQQPQQQRYTERAETTAS